MKKCNNCNKQIDDDSTFCKFCGNSQKIEDHCDECGYALIGNVKSCSKCGNEIR